MNQAINNILPNTISPTNQQKSVASSTNGQTDFSGMLKNALQKVNDYQADADKKTDALASGDVNQLHDVMVSAQKANLSLETSVQIQQKAIDAYQDIMRMQV